MENGEGGFSGCRNFPSSFLLVSCRHPNMRDKTPPPQKSLYALRRWPLPLHPSCRCAIFAQCAFFFLSPFLRLGCMRKRAVSKAKEDHRFVSLFWGTGGRYQAMKTQKGILTFGNISAISEIAKEKPFV